MLERNIVYIAKWFFDSDYVSIAINMIQKVIRIVREKKMGNIW